MSVEAIGGTTPLRGIRVLELSGIGPSRYAGMILADLGAEVVLVERPGQDWRRADSVVARGRTRIAVDLKRAADRQVLMELIGLADVLVEPYRPGVAERLGIGPRECLAVNPRLIYARMTGWGQSGPLAHTAGHDITYLAITGVLNAIGRAGERPQIPLNLVGDFGGGAMFLITGILAALVRRARTGAGSVVDAAIVDGATSLAAFIFGMRADGQWSDQRGTNVLDSGAPYYDVYETSDGRWMAVGAIEPQFFAELVRLLEPVDAPEQHDREQWPQLRAAIAARFRTRTRDEWAEVFSATDACVAPVLSFEEAAANTHLAARGTLVTSHGAVAPAPAPRFDGVVESIGVRPGDNDRDIHTVLLDWRE